MKREFTPGHFFMNKSLIWRQGRQGRVEPQECRRGGGGGSGGGRRRKRIEGGRRLHRKDGLAVGKGGPSRAEYRVGEGAREEKGGEERRKREEAEDGQGGWVWGPRTHVGEKEQDPGEQRDDLPGQPQVVHGGAVRVRGLGGGGRRSSPAPPTPSPGSTGPLASPTCDPREPPPPSPRWVLPSLLWDPLCPAPPARPLTVPSSGWW